MNYWAQNKNNIFVAAHRGLRATYPENTMEAFKAALEVGVDQLETDVRCSKDGELVLMHDLSYDNITNAVEVFGKKNNYVSSITLEEAKALIDKFLGDCHE